MKYSEIDLRRHIACEVCDIKVSGGYDPQLNQVRCHVVKSYFKNSKI
jgi:hypothetical protein